MTNQVIKKIVCCGMAVLMLVGMCACSTEQKEEVKLPDVVEVKKPNDFYHEFQEYILESDMGNENFVVSPVSFRNSMASTTYGAAGETQKELLSAMGFYGVNEYQTWVNEIDKFAKIYTFGEETYNDGSYKDMTLKQAKDGTIYSLVNTIWQNDTFSSVLFNEQYKTDMKEKFGIDIHNSAIDTFIPDINEFVSSSTRKLIPEIMDPNTDASNIPAVFLNTLYFKSVWNIPLTYVDSYNDNFRTKKGEMVEKEYMKTMAPFNYYKDKDTELVVLPMQNGVNVAFVKGDIDNVYDKIGQSAIKRVKVSIPRCSIETSVGKEVFENYLESKGVSLAFTSDGDFSTMTNDKRFHLDGIIQKAKIDMNEKGIEAAASSVVIGFGNTSVDDYIELNFDSYYTFFVYTVDDNGNYETMFFGQVCE